jgi:hypothetical protein
MYVHSTYAVTPAREPLGIFDAWMWAREKKDAVGRRGGPKKSLRWIEGYERLAELAPHVAATRLVYVADREADMHTEDISFTNFLMQKASEAEALGNREPIR